MLLFLVLRLLVNIGIRGIMRTFFGYLGPLGLSPYLKSFTLVTMIDLNNGLENFFIRIM